jgi:L-lysine 2,3-aminomutase
MDVGIKDKILAIVTTNRDAVSSATVPVFYADTEGEKEKIALMISKITMSMVHDLQNGCYVLVKH